MGLSLWLLIFGNKNLLYLVAGPGRNRDLLAPGGTIRVARFSGKAHNEKMFMVCSLQPQVFIIVARLYLSSDVFFRPVPNTGIRSLN